MYIAKGFKRVKCCLINKYSHEHNHLDNLINNDVKINKLELNADNTEILIEYSNPEKLKNRVKHLQCIVDEYDWTSNQVLENLAEIKPKKYSFSNLNDNLGHFNLLKIFSSLPEKSTIYFNGLQIESNVLTFENTFVKFIELKSGNSVILKCKQLKIESDLFEVTISSEHSLLCFKAQCTLIIKEFTSKLSEEELKDVFNIFPFIDLKSEYKYVILVPCRCLTNYKLNSYFNSRSDKNEIVDLINKLKGNINYIFWIQTRYLFYLKDWINILSQFTKCSFLLYVDDYLMNENKLQVSLSKYDLCNEDFDILSSLKIVEMIAYKTCSIKLTNLICNILKMQSVKMNLK